MDTEKTKANYLGDGVYVHLATPDGQICLTTGNHDPSYADNIIYLEPEQIENLKRWLSDPQPY